MLQSLQALIILPTVQHIGSILHDVTELNHIMSLHLSLSSAFPSTLTNQLDLELVLSTLSSTFSLGK